MTAQTRYICNVAQQRDEPFIKLAAEVRKLFHQLAATVEALHVDLDGITASHRAVLESLYRGGDQTVPALARSRPVSRQHIQTLVNALETRKLVEAIANPAHLRSPLIRITPAGRACFEEMRSRERALLTSKRSPVTVTELESATDILRRLREHLATITPAS